MGSENGKAEKARTGEATRASEGVLRRRLIGLGKTALGFLVGAAGIALKPFTGGASLFLIVPAGLLVKVGIEEMISGRRVSESNLWIYR